MSGLALQLVLMGLEKAAASRDSPTAVMLGKSHAQRAIYEAAFVSSPAKLQAAHMQSRSATSGTATAAVAIQRSDCRRRQWH